MTGSRILGIGLVLGTWFAPVLPSPSDRGDEGISVAQGQEKKPDEKKPEHLSKEVAAAREKGLDWLTKNQEANGAWGKSYTIGITGMGCLAFLSATDEPFTGERGKSLVKGLQFLMDNQKDGMFLTQGQSVRTWIHGQGFASLALSEAYGRSLFCKVKPDIDVQKIRTAVVESVKAIAKNQSKSGGWYYTRGHLNQDEGATTVCAVQALVSAENFGIEIDPQVIDKGFEYLKKSQNKDGSFNYILGDGQSMKGGTAAGVATLGLMKKFDFTVMINGYKYLLDFTPARMSAPHTPWYFPYYGHYYGTMGMHLLGQEYKDDKEFRTNTTRYIAETQKELVPWQQEDGGWPNKGWIKDQEKGETNAYSTTFAAMTLFVPEGRLSIYNRIPPKLPKQ
ncbi:MAG: terpene cyclase/mutase family protein [Gemmataceae bacterium]|nr:terpene cyclase/mutase family protein [Gemmataceae bacterium]